MNRSIQWFFPVLLLVVLMVSTGACRENTPPIIGKDPPRPASVTTGNQAQSPVSPTSGNEIQSSVSPTTGKDPETPATPTTGLTSGNNQETPATPTTGPTTGNNQEAPATPTTRKDQETPAVPTTGPTTAKNQETPAAPTTGHESKSPASQMVASLVAEAQAAEESGKKSKKKARPPGENVSSEVSSESDKRFRPGDNRSKAVPLAKDGIHDPTSPAMQLLQSPSQALSAIPEGKWGEVDWMRAIKEGIIKPYASLNGKQNMEILDLDIILTNTKTMPHVRFPHESHTRWLACSNCHPEIFIPKKGANAMPMDAIFKGRFCGTCHGRVAFSVYICQRCHSITHENSPAKWW
ncbi:MAG: hypothetical protein H7839_06920 [Magnetococcus sp. YQC-5]